MHLRCDRFEDAVGEALAQVRRIRETVAERVLEDDAHRRLVADDVGDVSERESDLPQLPRRELELVEHVLPVVRDDVQVELERASHVQEHHDVVEHVGHVGLRLPWQTLANTRAWKRR